MAERRTSFAQQEILVPLELAKGKLIYAPTKIYVPKKIYASKKDFHRCGTRSARRFKKSTYIEPASVSSMGGYYAARTQRVDLLD